jgi:dynein heavy chain, axonemal
MIKTFKTLLARKRKIISDLIFKYENGYQSIILTEREVTRIREELTKMQPELKRTAEETDIMFKKVEVEKANADVIKSGIEEEEKMVKQAVMEAKDIAADCQRELDEVRPDFEKAQ